MRNSKMVIGLVGAMTLMVVSTVFAFGPCGGGGACGFGRGMAMCPCLSSIDNLTKEQKDQINTLRSEFLRKQVTLRSQKAQKRIDLMELASKSPQDEAAIQKKKEEIWAIQDQMRNGARAFGTKIRSLLTPEQREKMGVWMGRRAGFCGAGGCGMGGGMGRGMGMRGGMGMQGGMMQMGPKN
ncbi:MAG: Spy/CpxP family protein refolding chaperone [Deltaproteobacteria bacterium]|nr:Spy/CpxP family protein refolding chaperone [Deltaproteobacteria bacterium]